MTSRSIHIIQEIDTLALTSRTAEELAALIGKSAYAVKIWLPDDLSQMPDSLVLKISALIFSLESQGKQCIIAVAPNCIKRMDAGRIQSVWKRLSGLMALADFVEIPFNDLELCASLRQRVPAAQRIFRTKVASPDLLEDQLKTMTVAGARFYQIEVAANDYRSCFDTLKFIKASNRTDLIIWNQGIKGLWTQLLGPYCGNAAILCADHPGSDFLNYKALVTDYGFPHLRTVLELYGIAGNPVKGSLSPQLHNKAYTQLQLPALYVPLHIDSYEEFEKEVLQGDPFRPLGITLRGLTVVSPFKQQGYASAQKSRNELATITKACNVLVRENGQWIADTTDSMGVLNGLAKRQMAAKGLKAAIIGCGGSGSTIALALKLNGAQVHLINRSIDKGEELADFLGVSFTPLADFNPADFELIVNATPVGRRDGDMLIAPSMLNPRAVVVDMIYRQQTTSLIKESHLLGHETIDGHEILAWQVKGQFQKMTDREMPAHVLDEYFKYKSKALAEA